MKNFLDENFLLTNSIAEELYHNHASKMPIIDYHNHLSPEMIATDHQFSNLSEAWLSGDHYKWRAMRANGVDEKFITGSATGDEKFQKWAETVPYTLRNPLYHWTHLELQRYFDIDELLFSNSASDIYEAANQKLKSKSHSCQGLLKMMKVEVLCTTDDPIDDLKFHQELQNQNSGFEMRPTFRPDQALGFGDTKKYLSYLRKLQERSGIQITSPDTLLDALKNRVEYFHQHGCRVSDLGFNQLPRVNQSNSNLDTSFSDLLSGKQLSEDEIENLQAYVLTVLCKMYHAKKWVQQFHLGALRNNNSRAWREIGPDAGYDSIGDYSHGQRLSGFFDHLDTTDELSKTILYNLNPRDNDLFATMAGNFNDGKVIGKIQFGSGWWFLDQKMGMENQINSLSNMGLLSRFIGMLTDSRSFLSFPRHEYFRRILCNLLGTDVMQGEIPYDIGFLGKLVEDICYHNAKAYFDFKADS